MRVRISKEVRTAPPGKFQVVLYDRFRQRAAKGGAHETFDRAVEQAEWWGNQLTAAYVYDDQGRRTYEDSAYALRTGPVRIWPQPHL
jgi:hypothetical protein